MSRALVIGAGSIGLRHVTVLEELGHDVAVVTGRTDVAVRSFVTVDAALADFAPEYVVVAVETSRHAVAVHDLRDSGFTGALLVEKPVAVDAEALEGYSAVGVGYNLRFHPVIERLAVLLADATIHTVEVYVGQHLSTWRPERNASDQYSAHRSRGGGVLRDLSHEFDYLATLLGGCRGVFARGGRLADVTVDSDDAWGIVAEYDRAPVVTIQLNYLDRSGRRRILVNTSESTIEADLVGGSVTVDSRVESFDLDRNTTYRAMHEAMLSGSSRVSSVEQALAVEHVVEIIESSANTGMWVSA